MADLTLIDARNARATTNVACSYAPRVAAEDDACVCAGNCLIIELHPVGIALGLLPGPNHNQKQNTLTNALQSDGI